MPSNAFLLTISQNIANGKGKKVELLIQIKVVTTVSIKQHIMNGKLRNGAIIALFLNWKPPKINAHEYGSHIHHKYVHIL